MSLFDRVLERLRRSADATPRPTGHLVAHWNALHWERFEVARWTNPDRIALYLATGRCDCHPNVPPPSEPSAGDGPAFG